MSLTTVTYWILDRYPSWLKFFNSNPNDGPLIGLASMCSSKLVTKREF